MSIILYSPNSEGKLNLNSLVRKLGYERGFPVKTEKEMQKILNEVDQVDLVFLDSYGNQISDVWSLKRKSPKPKSQRGFPTPSAITQKIASYLNPYENIDFGLISKQAQKELVNDWNYWHKRLQDETGNLISMAEMKEYPTPIQAYINISEKYFEEKAHKELKEASERFNEIWAPIRRRHTDELDEAEENNENLDEDDIFERDRKAVEIVKSFEKELETIVKDLNFRKRDNLQALYEATHKWDWWLFDNVFAKVLSQFLPSNILGPLAVISFYLSDVLEEHGPWYREHGRPVLNTSIVKWEIEFKIPNDIVKFIVTDTNYTPVYNHIEYTDEKKFSQILEYLPPKDLNHVKDMFIRKISVGSTNPYYTWNKAVALFSHGRPGIWQPASLELPFSAADLERIRIFINRLQELLPNRVRIIDDHVEYR